MSWTPLPPGRAVPLPTHVCRLIAIIAAIVVRITHPQLGNAFAVLATELSARITDTII